MTSDAGSFVFRKYTIDVLIFVGTRIPEINKE